MNTMKKKCVHILIIRPMKRVTIILKFTSELSMKQLIDTAKSTMKMVKE